MSPGLIPGRSKSILPPAGDAGSSLGSETVLGRRGVARSAKPSTLYRPASTSDQIERDILPFAVNLAFSPILRSAPSWLGPLHSSGLWTGQDNFCPIQKRKELPRRMPLEGTRIKSTSWVFLSSVLFSGTKFAYFHHQSVASFSGSSLSSLKRGTGEVRHEPCEKTPSRRMYKPPFDP
jgi:hypothetical protein